MSPSSVRSSLSVTSLSFPFLLLAMSSQELTYQDAVTVEDSCTPLSGEVARTWDGLSCVAFLAVPMVVSHPLYFLVSLEWTGLTVKHAVVTFSTVDVSLTSHVLDFSSKDDLQVTQSVGGHGLGFVATPSRSIPRGDASTRLWSAVSSLSSL